MSPKSTIGKTNDASSDAINLLQDQIAGKHPARTAPLRHRGLWCSAMDGKLSHAIRGDERGSSVSASGHNFRLFAGVQERASVTIADSCRAWRAVTLNGAAPQIRAPFYGIVFFDDFIGTYPSVQIAPLNISGIDTTFFSAYGAYHSEELQRVAIVKCASSLAARVRLTLQLAVLEHDLELRPRVARLQDARPQTV